jgi:hypothetical protein
VNRRVVVQHAAPTALLVFSALLVWKLRIIDPAVLPARGMNASGDLYTQIYPVVHRAAEWIRAGTVPLWNPYQICGHPLLATGIYGVSYPLNVFYLFLPTAVAMEVVIVLHLALSAVFMYALARSLEVAREWAVAAAVFFSWSGYIMMEATWFPAAISTAAWLPLGLLAVEQLVRGRGPLWSIVVALAVSLAFLAGWPQSWVYSMYAYALYATIRLIGSLILERDLVRALKAAACLGGGVALGAGLMAVQLLPAVELQRLGPRSAGGLTPEQVSLFGPFSARWFLNAAFDSSPQETSIQYVGMATVLLAVLSPFASVRRAPLVIFWAFAIISVGVALGVASPFYWLHRSLPVLAWFRVPPRALLLYALSAPMLAAVGLQALDTASTGRKRELMAILFAAAALALFGIATRSMRNTIYIAAAVVLAAGIALAARPRLRRLLVMALAALVAYDLFHAACNPWMRPYHGVEPYDREQAVLDYVKKHQGFDRTYLDQTFGVPAVMAKQGTLRGIYSMTDYEPLSLSRYDRLYRLLESERTRRNSAFTFTGWVDADPVAPGFPLIDLMSVRFLVIRSESSDFYEPLARFGPKWRRIDVPGSTGEHVLYENTDVLPRAYVAHAARFVSGDQEALEAVASANFKPREEVIIESDAPIWSHERVDRPITAAQILKYEPADVVIESETPEPGFLVLTDTFFPGWLATVDGAPVPILRANFLFRAVPVGAGRHVIAFTYAPSSFLLGAAITAASIFATLTVLLWVWVRHRRRPADHAERPDRRPQGNAA